MSNEKFENKTFGALFFWGRWGVTQDYHMKMQENASWLGLGMLWGWSGMAGAWKP
jgi:hypothetical protein